MQSEPEGRCPVALSRTLNVDAGATFLFPFVWRQAARDSDGAVIYDVDPLTGVEVPRAGEPVDLTGYDARMMIRKSVGDAQPMLSLTKVSELTPTTSGITIDGPAGLITVQMSAAATTALAGSGVYDVELVNPVGFVYRILQGKVRLSREVTR